MRLSKSKYCLGVQCPKALHLHFFKPELAPPIDPAQQRLFDQGHLVGIAAREQYPGGVLIAHDHQQSEAALEATQTALARNVPAIFEGAFLFQHTLVRVDVLRNNRDGTWDIIEVKSSTGVKDVHFPDMAIQRFVLEGTSLKIGRSILKYINNQCVHPYLEDLFSEEDCTAKVQAELPATADRVGTLLKILANPESPTTSIGPQCNTPYACAFKEHCWKAIPEHSVFELGGVSDKIKFELYQQGILKIADIPELRKIPRVRANQLEAVRQGKPVLDKKGLGEFLGEIKYPIYFFDFETINSAIPVFPGTRPFEQTPFQFSCHIQSRPGGECEWKDFLAADNQDPRTALTDKMLSVLRSEGTIFSYYAEFEKGVIRHLAQTQTAQGNELRALLARFMDLRDAFTKFYFHPNFHGSTSIKDTLPVVVPGMSYDKLLVRNGAMAQVAYVQMFDEALAEDERASIRSGLVSYCKQDTWAMVEILRRLFEIAH